MKNKLFAVWVSLLAAFAAHAVAVDEKPLEDPALEAQARALMKEIRCLQCQNQSIEDSNADIARDLRALIRERIALGDSPENVKSYLVDRYGDWVLLKPPVKSSTYFLWGSPFFVVLIIAFLLVRRKQSQSVAAPLSADEEARLQELLEREQ
ncbi:MAG: cytochrome c-type biogenesis protein CcmH [Kordiimonadaceae bacterium]|nr:cytochrome c-type biogenesis protein CcmH [Kordiimonadaceae bacterium]MBO6568523.1 cytochrome c-type biogenesis protein CcmH [Kordiimonadaceae bacterium]MBO6963748.1 cytochrome c-type biogenesis protein CcmH [Kordiimonadaceae bacterium]